jgi:hypothetical protein
MVSSNTKNSCLKIALILCYADAQWFSAGIGILQHGPPAFSVSSGNQYVLRSSEFSSDGILMDIEYYGSTAGVITVLVRHKREFLIVH